MPARCWLRGQRPYRAPARSSPRSDIPGERPGCSVRRPGANAMRRAALAILILCLGWMQPAGAADIDVDRPLLLVATPELYDPLYGAAVLVVTPIGGDEHVGFIVNRPTGTRLENLFPEHAPSRKV